MAIQWFKAQFEKIEAVDIIKETEKQVTLPNGRRVNKVSDWVWCSETRDKAKALMVAQYRFEAEQAKSNFDILENRLKNAEQL